MVEVDAIITATMRRNLNANTFVMLVRIVQQAVQPLTVIDAYTRLHHPTPVFVCTLNQIVKIRLTIFSIQIVLSPTIQPTKIKKENEEFVVVIVGESRIYL